MRECAERSWRGAALFIRTDIYKEIGGLDANFFAHQEEIDLCWRIRLRGYDIAVAPKSTVYHYGAATLSQNNPKKTYLNFRNNLLMIYKNIEQSKLNKVMFYRFILDYISLIMFVLKGDIKSAKAVYKARRDFNNMLCIYENIRTDIQDKRLVKDILVQKKYSIVWQYFFLRKKIYSKLPK